MCNPGARPHLCALRYACGRSRGGKKRHHILLCPLRQKGRRLASSRSRLNNPVGLASDHPLRKLGWTVTTCDSSLPNLVSTEDAICSHPVSFCSFYCRSRFSPAFDLL